MKKLVKKATSAPSVEMFVVCSCSGECSGCACTCQGEATELTDIRSDRSSTSSYATMNIQHWA